MQGKQDTPYPSAPIRYGGKQQYAMQKSLAPPLDAKGKKFIQQLCGKFLFLGRVVNSTLLCPVSALAAQSSKPTQDTLHHVMQVLDNDATQEEAVLTFRCGARLSDSKTCNK
jgi:hypothetical protein